MEINTVKINSYKKVLKICMMGCFLVPTIEDFSYAVPSRVRPGYYRDDNGRPHWCIRISPRPRHGHPPVNVDYQQPVSPPVPLPPPRIPSLIELKITRASPLHIFNLPDGSEVHTNDKNQVWVKEPDGPGYPAIRWDDYAKKKGLSIVTNVETGSVDEAEFRIRRLSQPFLLPGGYEVAVNGNDEAWVKEPGQGYYATPYQAFADRVGLAVRSIVTNPVELKITRASPLHIFKLSDGSEIHTNDQNQVWVKEPDGPGYPAIRWDDYAKKKGLSIVTNVETGSVDAVELHIERMSQSFLLPGGYEVAVNGNDEVWVKEPGQGYYATSYQTFANRLNLTLVPAIRYENE